MLNSHLELMKKVARDAGKAAMAFYGSENTVVDKGGGNPVSEADMASHDAILNGLKGTGVFVMSEEDLGGEERLIENKLFIVDPLDGTKDFLQQTGDFSIILAYVENNSPVVACVYKPVGDVLYFAEKGGGAHREKAGVIEEIKVSSENDYMKMKILISRNHLLETELNLINTLGIGEKVKMGSAGLKACAVAEGSAEIYLNTSDKTGEWDICAGDLMIEEAGGKVLDLNGNSFSYNREDVVNRNGFLVHNDTRSTEILDSLNL
jgi:3'(2'), 5'-bisphosphate nucleotidase